MKKIELSFLFFIVLIQSCSWDLGFPGTDCRYLIECPCTVEDEEGNIYNTVQIGNQCWMAENLKTGTQVDRASDVNPSDNIVQKLCLSPNCIEGGFYKQTELRFETNGVKSICPNGWQLPTSVDFDVLESHIGDYSSERNIQFDHLLSTFNPSFIGRYELDTHTALDIYAYYWAYNEINIRTYFWILNPNEFWVIYDETAGLKVSDELFFNCRCVYKNE